MELHITFDLNVGGAVFGGPDIRQMPSSQGDALQSMLDAFNQRLTPSGNAVSVERQVYGLTPEICRRDGNPLLTRQQVQSLLSVAQGQAAAGSSLSRNEIPVIKTIHLFAPS